MRSRILMGGPAILLLQLIMGGPCRKSGECLENSFAGGLNPLADEDSADLPTQEGPLSGFLCLKTAGNGVRKKGNKDERHPPAYCQN